MPVVHQGGATAVTAQIGESLYNRGIGTDSAQQACRLLTQQMLHAQLSGSGLSPSHRNPLNVTLNLSATAMCSVFIIGHLISAHFKRGWVGVANLGLSGTDFKLIPQDLSLEPAKPANICVETYASLLYLITQSLVVIVMLCGEACCTMCTI